MSRTCIFCGKHPKKRNDEHVLPRWLLELTGDPNRVVYLSTNFDSEKHLVSPRQFAFSKFVFPSCVECNDEHGRLEGATKEVILKLLSAEAITGMEIHTLLDWLDKIRIGTWLAELRLSGNPLGIEPNFHIAERIGQTDRAVYVSRIAPGNALTVVGTLTPCFALLPSAFGIRINDLLLVNVATDFLFSERLGFPYPRRRDRVPNSKLISWEMEGGHNRAKLPLIPHAYPFPSAKFFQPMFCRFAQVDEFRHFYDVEYVRAGCESWENGVGQVFTVSRSNLLPVERGAEISLTDHEIRDHPRLRENFERSVLKWQIFLMRFMPSHRRLKKEKSRAVSWKTRWAVRMNMDLIKQLDTE